jgi:hypothetical protein
MARPASPVALNWVRFFGHLCTFIGFFSEKLGSFRNFNVPEPPIPPGLQLLRASPRAAPCCPHGSKRRRRYGLPIHDNPPRASRRLSRPAPGWCLCQRTPCKSVIGRCQSAIPMPRTRLVPPELRKPESVPAATIVNETTDVNN